MYKTGMKIKKGYVISVEEAEALLEWEVNNKTIVLSALLSLIQINQNQFDALTSFSYNEGVGAFAGSTLLKVIKKNPNDPYITECFAMWNEITVNGKKVVSEDLVGRRKREAELYFKPIN